MHNDNQFLVNMVDAVVRVLVPFLSEANFRTDGATMQEDGEGGKKNENVGGGGAGRTSRPRKNFALSRSGDSINYGERGKRQFVIRETFRQLFFLSDFPTHSCSTHSLLTCTRHAPASRNNSFLLCPPSLPLTNFCPQINSSSSLLLP